MQLSHAVFSGVRPCNVALPLLSHLVLHCRWEALIKLSYLRSNSRFIHTCSSSSSSRNTSALVYLAGSSATTPFTTNFRSPSVLSFLSNPFHLEPTRRTSTSPFTSATHFTRPLSSSSSSSSSGSSFRTPNGPHELLASKCRVLPFSLSREEADHEWRRHHEGLFTSQPSSATTVKASLLPFWCICTEAHVTLHSAQIGRDYIASIYNPMTRRYESRWETTWHTVVPNWRYSRRWSTETQETQVYGGSKYRNDPALGRMRPGEYVRQAQIYSEYLRGAADKEQPDRLVPFRLGPAEAVEAARQAVRQSELRNAEQQLLRTYGGDRVRLVSLDVQLAGLTATPVFAPVFVFKTRVRGTSMRTYVAGFRSGMTSGPVFPNAVRVAATAAAVAPVALLATGVLGGFSWSAALLLGVCLPYLLAYGAASLWPELHSSFLSLRARLQRPLPDAAQEEQERWWRYEWVRQDTDDSQGYSYSDDGNDSHSYRRDGGFGFGGFARGNGHEGQRQGRKDSSGGNWWWQQQQREQQQQKAGGGGGRAATGAAPGSDPKGYYRILGVTPNSSTEEIQAAFRAAALRWHPD
ncbi:hypothetical protein VaNZ11_011633, partial [Volvox africanus]